MTTTRATSGPIGLPTTAMKIRAVILTALTILSVSLPNGSNAAIPPPLPAANPFVNVIVEISPSQAAVGQVIVVRTEQTALARIAQQLSPANKGLKLPTLPNAPGPGIPKIYFRGFFGPRIPGQNVTPLGNDRYSVVVPQGALSGILRFETSAGNSYSTVSFTVVINGYSVANRSQFNVVSIKVDDVERLINQTLPAALPGEPNVFVADIGATAGNHSMQVTLGPSASQPVIVYFLGAVPATNPSNVIVVTTVLAGELLVDSPNVATNGTSVTASWQTLIVNPDASLSVNGFDFTHDTETGATIWTNWFGDRPNVVASGRVTEPASWPLNPTSTVLQLHRSNGDFYTDIAIDLLDKTLVADDGFSYELQ